MHTLHVVGSVSVTVQVRDFQAVIGKEVRQQCLEKMGGKPDILLACVGGGSNAIGLFHEFVDDADVRLIGRLPSFSIFLIASPLWSIRQSPASAGQFCLVLRLLTAVLPSLIRERVQAQAIALFTKTA